MTLFLQKFAREPGSCPSVRMVYEPAERCNTICLDDERTAADGTLITKSHEAHDQREIGLFPYALSGTLLTLTREGRDTVEHQAEVHRIAESLLLGTKRTDSREQGDPHDAAHLGTLLTDTRESRDNSEHSPSLEPVARYQSVESPLCSPWPISQRRHWLTTE